MREIELNQKNHLAVLREAVDVLNNGGVIIYPTETSYGLGANFLDKEATEKIYKIKKRDDKKALPVIVPDLMTATTLVEFPQQALGLANEHWPGPLTLVLPYRYCQASVCDDYLALRVSSHPFVTELLRNFGAAIISTSANIAGSDNCYTVKDVREQFKYAEFKPDLFINFGNLPINKPSTIIKIDENNHLEILRQGDLKI
ncbi:threonylcarbamoyl-AMP synthase [bacterium]|jgi:L-threonylcarbamoyladenylate synthase|nr:threonylcarbamoyl-AMP synthase [bacterium]MBT4649346.1 threonylcarbamoyl-AMP synthase [bacterium]